LTVSNSALGGTGTVVIPLVPGTNTFVPTAAQPTMSPLGPVNGTSYLSADGTFFYANLTPVNAPTQREFIAGGLPVSASALAPSATNPIIGFTVQPDAALQSNIPFIRNNAGGTLAAYVSPLYLAQSTAIGNVTALQSSLAINGQGTNQQSVLITAIGTGATLQSSGAPAINGVVRGTSQLSAISTPVRIGSSFTSVVDGNGNSLYGGSAISGFVLDQTQYNANGSGVLTTPVIPSTASEVALLGTATNYGFNQPATSTTLPAGVGTNRTAACPACTTPSLTAPGSGYFGGVMNTSMPGVQPYAITGSASLSTDAATNRIAATLTSDNTLSSATTGGVSSIQMQFGGATGNSAFVDSNIYGAAESQTTPTLVNGNPAQSSQLYFLSQGAATPPTSLLPPGVSYCNCQYLQWGYWGGDIGSGVSRIDRGGINFWVAGQLTQPSDIMKLAAMQGATGTNNYLGHLIGTVFNNGAQYVAAGGLSASYTFATQMGSFSVNNYDGQSFTVSGKVTTAGGGTQYSAPIATITQQGAPIAGAINGSFYGPMAANTGGNFSFHTVAGPTYLTSGIFAAAKH